MRKVRDIAPAYVGDRGLASVDGGRRPVGRAGVGRRVALPAAHASDTEGAVPLLLRDAVPADAPVLLALIRALAAYEREPDAVETTAETLAAQLAAPQPPFAALLAEEDGVVLGFALHFATYSTWRGRAGVHLEDLFVVPEARGRGIGFALLAALARHAVGLGAARLEWSVLDWNRPAIDFYERLGAQPLSEWTTYRLDRDALARLAAAGPEIAAPRSATVTPA
jgi:GNAT superfamily N-acetyltransferase